MKSAIVYIRVSTDMQVKEGVSLDAQQAKALAWCELNDYQLKAIFTDAGLSGKRADNRPALQNALAACGKGDALVVYSLSRLARSTKDTIAISEILMKKGTDLVSLSEKIDTTSPAGRMVFKMLAVLAEFESDQLGERVSSSMQLKRSRFERVGSIPYGYHLAECGIKLLPNSHEQEAIALCQALNAQGLSLRKIAHELTKRQFQPRGKKWHATSIMRILKP